MFTNLPYAEALSLVLLAALVWLWVSNLRAREAAMQAAQTACSAEGLLLLDDTVAMAGFKVVRNAEGRITLKRTYEFEFSDTGDNRRRGSVTLLGHLVIVLSLDTRKAAERHGDEQPNVIQHPAARLVQDEDSRRE